jgi:hypothetical protein
VIAPCPSCWRCRRLIVVCVVRDVVDGGGSLPCVGGGQCGVLQGTSEVEGHLRCAWVVAYDRHSECILKAGDEEADLVLFTSNAACRA